MSMPGFSNEQYFTWAQYLEPTTEKRNSELTLLLSLFYFKSASDVQKNDAADAGPQQSKCA